MPFQFIFHSLFAAGFDWLEAILPLLFVLIWIISQVVAVFRRVRGGVRENTEDDDNEDEIISNIILEQRMSGRQCKGCGATFVAPALAIVDCPECGRLTPPEIDGREVSAQEEVTNPVKQRSMHFGSAYREMQSIVPYGWWWQERKSYYASDFK